MKIYVSGGIKDVPDYLANFKRGVEWCERSGHEAVNPCTIEHAEGATYEQYMKADIIALLDCDAILMLKYWQTSRGARLEHDVAIACGLKLLYENNAANLE